MNAHKTAEDIVSFLADIMGNMNFVETVEKNDEERGVSYVIQTKSPNPREQRGLEYCIGSDNDELLFYHGLLIAGTAYQALKPLDTEVHPLATALVTYIKPDSQLLQK